MKISGPFYSKNHVTLVHGTAIKSCTMIDQDGELLSLVGNIIDSNPVPGIVRLIEPQKVMHHQLMQREMTLHGALWFYGRWLAVGSNGSHVVKVSCQLTDFFDRSFAARREASAAMLFMCGTHLLLDCAGRGQAGQKHCKLPAPS